MNFMIDKLDWEKMSGLLPVIIQHAETADVLMLGYMNQAALQTTLQTREVTFYSRSKKRLWTKGELSGNKLLLVDIFSDCDQDTLLITATSKGPTCHQGAWTCFGDAPCTDWQFIKSLTNIIQLRTQSDPDKSYTAKLIQQGLHRVAQKVGEESIEVVLASVSESEQAFCEEMADLIFHLLILLQVKNQSLANVVYVLKKRRECG